MRSERNVLSRGVRRTLIRHVEDDNTQPQILITGDVSILLWRAQLSFFAVPLSAGAAGILGGNKVGGSWPAGRGRMFESLLCYGSSLRVNKQSSGVDPSRWRVNRPAGHVDVTLTASLTSAWSGFTCSVSTRNTSSWKCCSDGSCVSRVRSPAFLWCQQLHVGPFWPPISCLYPVDHQETRSDHIRLSSSGMKAGRSRRNGVDSWSDMFKKKKNHTFLE